MNSIGADQTILTEWADRVRSAAERQQPLCIHGGGSKDFYGNAPAGEHFDARAFAGIVNYEPTELVLTARCGTPLADVAAALAAEGQMLAFEPPHFGMGATLGGCIAAGLAGPRRAAQGIATGAVRDSVLGARLLDGRGRLLCFGGRVMKNVAGYDVSRLLAGSLGILGVILEVSLKVTPQPAAEQTLCFAYGEMEVLTLLRRWTGKPLPISASSWCEGVLHLRLSGAHAAVEAACRSLGGEWLDAEAAEQWWRAVREQSAAYFHSAQPLWRISVPPAAPPLGMPGMQLFEWGGALRWLYSEQPVAAIRARAAELGGHATLFRGGDRSAGVFTPLPSVLWQIHRRLKAEFDPAGIFNPGRLYAGL